MVHTLKNPTLKIPPMDETEMLSYASDIRSRPEGAFLKYVVTDDGIDGLLLNTDVPEDDLLRFTLPDVAGREIRIGGNGVAQCFCALVKGYQELNLRKYDVLYKAAILFNLGLLQSSKLNDHFIRAKFEKMWADLRKPAPPPAAPPETVVADNLKAHRAVPGHNELHCYVCALLELLNGRTGWPVTDYVDTVFNARHASPSKRSEYINEINTFVCLLEGRVLYGSYLSVNGVQFHKDAASLALIVLYSKDLENFAISLARLATIGCYYAKIPTTRFIDFAKTFDIGDPYMIASMQKLEDRLLEKVGDKKPMPVDVRKLVESMVENNVI